MFDFRKPKCSYSQKWPAQSRRTSHQNHFPHNFLFHLLMLSLVRLKSFFSKLIEVDSRSTYVLRKPAHLYMLAQTQSKNMPILTIPTLQTPTDVWVGLDAGAGLVCPRHGHLTSNPPKRLPGEQLHLQLIDVVALVQELRRTTFGQRMR